MLTTETNQDYRAEYSASIGARDIYITVKRYADGMSYNAGQIWVTVEERVYCPAPSTHSFDKFLFDCHVSEATNDLDAIRTAFRDQWQQLRGFVRNWNQFREWARWHQRGKRGYYTKHANQYKARIPAQAAQWKLCKQLWKEITKL